VVLRKSDVELRVFATITTFAMPRDITLDNLRIESAFPPMTRRRHGAKHLRMLRLVCCRPLMIGTTREWACGGPLCDPFVHDGASLNWYDQSRGERSWKRQLVFAGS
jgi:hypothetical protein